MSALLDIRGLTVDFTGRRFFSLVETESARWSDYVWNDGKGIYNAYRETIDFGAVESARLSFWQTTQRSSAVKASNRASSTTTPEAAGAAEDTYQSDRGTRKAATP